MKFLKIYNTWKWGKIIDFAYGINNRIIIYRLLTVFCLLKRILYGYISYNANNKISFPINGPNLHHK